MLQRHHYNREFSLLTRQGRFYGADKQEVECNNNNIGFFLLLFMYKKKSILLYRYLLRLGHLLVNVKQIQYRVLEYGNSLFQSFSTWGAYKNLRGDVLKREIFTILVKNGIFCFFVLKNTMYLYVHVCEVSELQGASKSP